MKLHLRVKQPFGNGVGCLRATPLRARTPFRLPPVQADADQASSNPSQTAKKQSTSLSEDVLARLKAAEEEAANLRKELAAAKAS